MILSYEATMIMKKFVYNDIIAIFCILKYFFRTRIVLYILQYVLVHSFFNTGMHTAVSINVVELKRTQQDRKAVWVFLSLRLSGH